MSPVDAFLLFTAFSYYVAATFSAAFNPVTKNIRPTWAEFVFMLLCGTFLALNLLLDVSLVWLVYAVFWSLATVATFLGYSEWNVLWKQDVSDVAQIAMAFWDAVIAVCCLIKF